MLAKCISAGLRDYGARIDFAHLKAREIGPIPRGIEVRVYYLARCSWQYGGHTFRGLQYVQYVQRRDDWGRGGDTAREGWKRRERDCIEALQ
jgi:hypothetical protein